MLTKSWLVFVRAFPLLSCFRVTTKTRLGVNTGPADEFLKPLTKADPMYWLPLDTTGEDARLASRKRIEHIPTAAWKCLFHPSRRQQSKAFAEHWAVAKAPDFSDPESPYFGALDKAIEDWDGDESKLSLDPADKQALTKWTTYNRCFQVDAGHNYCDDCHKAIEAILLLRRSFIMKTVLEASPAFQPSPYYIIGTGPGGLIAAVELAMMGHNVVAVERHYGKNGYKRARSTGVFRHTERLFSALGMPRYVSLNLFLYKAKRSVIFPSAQDYLKFVALKIGVPMLVDCDSFIRGNHLLIQSYRGSQCRSLVTDMQEPSLPGEAIVAKEQIYVNLGTIRMVAAPGAQGVSFTKSLLQAGHFQAKVKDMTEVARGLVCDKSQDVSAEDFYAPDNVLRSQFALLEAQANHAQASLNSAFKAAEDNRDLDRAWAAFKESLCTDVAEIIRLQTDGSLKNMSELSSPKSSFWYGIRAEAKSFFAFVYNLDSEPFNEKVWDQWRCKDLHAIMPCTSQGGGGKAMLQAIPNSIWVPSPNDMNLTEDALADDTPDSSRVGPHSWTRYHFEGTLIPPPLAGDSGITALSRVMMKSVFNPGKCSLVKSRHFLFEALSAFFGFSGFDEKVAHAARASLNDYFRRNENEPDSTAQNAAIFPIGFNSLSFDEGGSDELFTVDSDRRLFIIGDAALPAWFRFGIGIDDAKWGARAVVACSVLPREQCDKLVLAHEEELKRRPVQVFFNLWYHSIWQHCGESDAGMRLNNMLFKLGKEACSEEKKRATEGFDAGTCPPSFVETEDWGGHETSMEAAKDTSFCSNWDLLKETIAAAMPKPFEGCT